MKNILIAGAVLLLLNACATKQIAESTFACGGVASFEVAYFPDGNQAKSIKICSGTEGDKAARYELYDGSGNILKRIEVSGSGIHTARALEAVGATLKAASSEDAATKQAALKALPGVLSALVKIINPLP